MAEAGSYTQLTTSPPESEAEALVSDDIIVDIKPENEVIISTEAIISKEATDSVRSPLAVLLDAGFPELEAREALFIANDDVDQAIAYLLDQQDFQIPPIEIVKGLVYIKDLSSGDKGMDLNKSIGSSMGTSSDDRALLEALDNDMKSSTRRFILPKASKDVESEDMRKISAKIEMMETLESLRRTPLRLRSFCCSKKHNLCLSYNFFDEDWKCSLSTRNTSGCRSSRIDGDFTDMRSSALCRFTCTYEPDPDIEWGRSEKCNFNYCGACFESNYRVELPKCNLSHNLTLLEKGKNRGWICDAKKRCVSQGGFENVTNEWRWRCEQCDFDYCGPCYESILYITAERHKINLFNPKDNDAFVAVGPIKRRNSDPVPKEDKLGMPKLLRVPSDPITLTEKSEQRSNYPNSFFLDKPSSAFQSIVSRASRSFRTQAIETVTCKICYDNFPRGEMYEMLSCSQHFYCKPCLEMYCNTQINDGVVKIHCPEYQHCRCDINDDVPLIVSVDHYNKWKRIQEVKTNKFYRECPNCNTGISTGTLSHPVLTCYTCKTVFCFVHNNAHPDMTCSQYLDSLPARVRKEILESASLIKAVSKSCPGCDAPTEKSSGCNHMTCAECKTNWCWICNQNINDDISAHYSLTNVRGCPGAQFADVSLFDNLAAMLPCTALFCRSRCFYCFMSFYATMRTIAYLLFLLCTFGVVLFLHFAGYVCAILALLPLSLTYEILRCIHANIFLGGYWYSFSDTLEHLVWRPGILGLYVVWSALYICYLSVAIGPLVALSLVVVLYQLIAGLDIDLEVIKEIIKFPIEFTRDFLDS